jgi:hypothetical protein
MTPAPVLRPGDGVRVCQDFLAWVAAHPTAVLEVASITTIANGVKLLAVRWPRLAPTPARGRVEAAQPGSDGLASLWPPRLTGGTP